LLLRHIIKIELTPDYQRIIAPNLKILYAGV